MTLSLRTNMENDPYEFVASGSSFKSPVSGSESEEDKLQDVDQQLEMNAAIVFHSSKNDPSEFVSSGSPFRSKSEEDKLQDVDQELKKNAGDVYFRNGSSEFVPSGQAFIKGETSGYLEHDIQDRKKFKRQTDKNSPKKHETFKEGYAIIGTNKAVTELLDSLSQVKKRTGVITDMSIHPSNSNKLNEKNQYTQTEILGSGHFGVVSYCKHNETEKCFVIKEILRDKFNRREVEALLELDHPNIIKILGFIANKKVSMILMEYAGPSLQKLVLDKGFRIKDVIKILNFCGHGFDALNYMHQRDILHLDIKPANISISKNNEPIFTDFGCAKTKHDPFTPGTREYMSPEASVLTLEKELPEVKADINKIHIKCFLHLNGDSLEDYFLRLEQNLTVMLKKMPLSGKADVFSFVLTVPFLMNRDNISGNIIKQYLMKDKDKISKSMYKQCRKFITFCVAEDPNLVKKHAMKSEWPEVIRTLLENTLEGDANIRWSAAQALDYIEGTVSNFTPHRRNEDVKKGNAAQAQLEQKQLPTVVGSPACQGDGNSPDFSQLKSSL